MDTIALLTFLLLFIILFVSLFWIILWLSELEPFTEKKRRAWYPSLTLLIPAYNEEKNIAQTIQSALGLKYPRPFTIMVIDDGSTDGTAKVARKFPVKVLTVKHGGKANAVNAGIKRTDTRVIVTLDADSMPEPDALLHLIPMLGEDGVGAVTSALKVNAPNSLIERMQLLEYLSGILLRKLMSLIGCLYIIPGPMSAYKKEVFDRIGPFDVGNITEDTEIGLRMLYNNIRIENCPESIVYTKAPRNLKSFIKQRIRWYSGFLTNAQKYQTMFFNTRYGDIALFLPFMFLGFFSMFLSMAISVHYLEKGMEDGVRWMNGFIASGMDFGYVLELVKESLKIKLNALSIDWGVTFFGVIFFGMAIFLLAYAHKYTKEKRLSLSTYIVFLFIYYQFMGLVWVASVIKWLQGNKEW